MAEIIWTEPALEQLDEIAHYIALDKPSAAKQLVVKIFKAVDRLAQFPNSGREPPEMPASIYREVVCNPCRVFYRHEADKVFILHVMREERLLRQYLFDEDADS
ncbi:MAG: type II toxin-antitoxin system RelE/ParE family toxin [Methylophilaceae bacterium]|nr:type II toxin-antitoxin system RelE/ParE family toxin [Methylophilaceae bacterium]